MTADYHLVLKSIPTSKALALLLIFLLLGNVQAGLGGDEKDGGFGVNKTVVTFMLTHPPRLLVTQKTFGLNISGTESVKPALNNALKQIFNEAKAGIVYVPGGGELRINVDVVHDYSSRAFNRKVSVEKEDKTTKEKTTVEETHRFVEVISSFEASYEIQDWTGGSPASMGTGKYAPSRIANEIDMTLAKEKMISELETRQRGIAGLSAQMRPIFNQVNERIEVILGKVGDLLKNGTNLAERNNWRGAYEAWNAVPAFAFPKAESYRIYNLGVANEALGHEAFNQGQNVDETLKYLAEAKKLYEQAQRLKPDEKFFNTRWRIFDAPLDRISKSVTAYRAWKLRKEALQQVSRGRVDDLLSDNPVASSSNRSRGTANQSSPQGAAMSNDDVIELVKAKASDDFVAETISSAPATQFDLSVQGRISLLKSGVSEKVIRVMQQKQTPK